MLDLLKRMRDANTTFKGDLEFVNDWEYFSNGQSSRNLHRPGDSLNLNKTQKST